MNDNRKKNLRSRQKQKSSSSEEEEIKIVNKKRKQCFETGLLAKSQRFSKPTKKPASSSDEDSSENNSGSVSRPVCTFIRGAAITSNVSFPPETASLPDGIQSTQSAQPRIQAHQDSNATAGGEGLSIDPERTSDAQAIFERRQAVNRERAGRPDDNLYHGLENYSQQYTEARDTVAGNASSGHNRKGPMRAPSNVRVTTRWDYQPDICKDYKETGFCGFGDSCKFLHDRSDYKHGWQIERELEANTFGSCDVGRDATRYEIHSSDENRDDDEDGEGGSLPFKCFICRRSFVDPVRTKCAHYFCSKCALNRFKKSARCAACGADTAGIFSTAHKLIRRIESLANQKAQEAGLDVQHQSELVSEETRQTANIDSEGNEESSDSEDDAIRPRKCVTGQNQSRFFDNNVKFTTAEGGEFGGGWMSEEEQIVKDKNDSASK